MPGRDKVLSVEEKSRTDIIRIPVFFNFDDEIWCDAGRLSITPSSGSKDAASTM